MSSQPPLPATVDKMLEQGFRGPDGNSSERVQEPADREEMRELIARYAQRVYRRRSTADLLTEDGVITIRMPGYPLNQPAAWLIWRRCSPAPQRGPRCPQFTTR